MPPQAPFVPPEPPKKRILARVLILTVSIILILVALAFLTGGYGGIIVIESIKIPFRKIAEEKYQSPIVEEYARVGYRMVDPQFSTKSPFVVFREPVDYLFYADYDSSRTGLFNLETKEAVILAPNNGIPKNSSMFSPDGKRLLYAVAREADTEMFTNENGTWRTIYGFDLYVKDLYTGNVEPISKEDNSLWISKPSTEPYAFGWIDNDRIFYTCTPNKQKNGFVNHCSLDLKTKAFNDNSAVNTESIPKDAIQEDHIERYESGYNKSRTIRVSGVCEFGKYDGCAVPSVHLVIDGESKFLFNSSETPYILRWSYDDKLYGLLLGSESTSLYKLY